MSMTDRSSPMRLNTDTVMSQLADRGYRVTGPRREVVQLVIEQSKPFTAEQIVALLPAIGRATVYRTLEILASIDVVHRLLKSSGYPSYVVGQPGHRHHLICSSCAKVVEFSDCPVDELVRNLAQRTDFTISTHHLEISGLCPRCQPGNSSN